MIRDLDIATANIQAMQHGQDAMIQAAKPATQRPETGDVDSDAGAQAGMGIAALSAD